MSWYSILPPTLTTVETWVIRIFLLLALANLIPWMLAILYDVVLYVGRSIWYEVPVWGGRAQGAQRPRADELRLRERVRGLSFGNNSRPLLENEGGDAEEGGVGGEKDDGSKQSSTTTTTTTQQRWQQKKLQHQQQQQQQQQQLQGSAADSITEEDERAV